MSSSVQSLRLTYDRGRVGNYLQPTLCSCGGHQPPHYYSTGWQACQYVEPVRNKRHFRIYNPSLYILLV